MRKLISNLEGLKYMGLSMLSNKLPKLNLKANCSGYELVDDTYITFRRKPKYASNLITLNSAYDDQNKIAIVMQGPVIEKDNFTAETVKLYKKQYPSIRVVVSTWDTIKNEQLMILKDSGATVILSHDPRITGIGNINRQLVSTNAGLQFCKTEGINRVLKTRTDQRIYKMFFIEYLESLLNIFPLTPARDERVHRLVAFQSTVGSSMFIPFMISDMLFYGDLRDLELYFDIPYSEINHSNKQKDRSDFGAELIKNDATVFDYYMQMAPEMILAYHYAECLKDSKYRFCLEDSWKFIRDNFVVVGVDDLELYWPKYNHFEENVNFHIYEDADTEEKCLRYNWTFPNWLALYSGIIQYNESYNYLDGKKMRDFLC